MATEAPWAYPDDVEDVVSDDPTPAWACPEGLCECRPSDGAAKTIVHKLHLYDEEAKPMGDARVRVIRGGRVMNLDTPNASGDGTLQVAGVVDLQGLHVGAQQGGQLSQGGVLHCRGRLGHQGRSSLGLQADGLQGFGDRVGGHGLYCRRYCMSPQITHC